MEVVLLLSAERDLQEAYNWVEEHRQGREQFFLRDVDLGLEHLKRFPLIGRLYRGRYRRLLIPKYAFGIFYVVESNRIVIHAILIPTEHSNIVQGFQKLQIASVACRNSETISAAGTLSTRNPL